MSKVVHYQITQVRSSAGLSHKAILWLKSLGLKKRGSVSKIMKSDAVDGLIIKVNHLVKVEIV
jgi:ribosomal protein L30